MNALADAGIYVILDLSTPSESISRSEPAWNGALYNRYTSVVDAMAKYSNMLGFFAGNEVSNDKNNTDASAFVKAAVRDMKRYIKARGYRPMGVGYATNDDASIRVNMANYFDCGSAEDSIDFWGYNIYSWCGDSSYHESGFDERTEEFKNYTVPVFFAEYGCNAVQPRGFSEVSALYSDPMADVWSGGIVYMYFQEANDYGLYSSCSLASAASFPLMLFQVLFLFGATPYLHLTISIVSPRDLQLYPPPVSRRIHTLHRIPSSSNARLWMMIGPLQHPRYHHLPIKTFVRAWRSLQVVLWRHLYQIPSLGSCSASFAALAYAPASRGTLPVVIMAPIAFVARRSSSLMPSIVIIMSRLSKAMVILLVTLEELLLKSPLQSPRACVLHS